MHKRRNLGGEGVRIQSAINTAERRWLARLGNFALLGGPGRFACFHHPDGDQGGGTGGSGGGTPPPAGPPAGQEPPADDNDDPYAGLPEETVTKLKAAHQKELDRIAAKARDEGKKAGARETQKAADDAQKEADRKAEEAKGEWKKLYEDLKKETDPLRSTAAQSSELATEFHELIEGEIAEWPASVKKSDPGRDADIAVRRKWVADNRDVAKELLAARKPPAGEHGSGGSGGGGGGGGRPGTASPVDKYISGQRYAVPGQKKD